MECRYKHTVTKNNQTITVPCGSCIACRMNKANEWTGRLLTELFHSKKGYFVTLTYDDKHIPKYNGFETLSKTELQNLFKLLRHKILFRYYAVGEYGGQTHRPHYHILFFFKEDIEIGDLTRLILDTWKKCENIVIYTMNANNIDYCVRYVIEKNTFIDDICKQSGIEKQFAIMSRNKGLGFQLAFDKNVLSIIEDGYINWGKKYPLSPYVRNLLKQFHHFEYYTNLKNTNQQQINNFIAEIQRIQKLPSTKYETYDTIRMYYEGLDEKQAIKRNKSKKGRR